MVSDEIIIISRDVIFDEIISVKSSSNSLQVNEDYEILNTADLLQHQPTQRGNEQQYNYF